MMSKKFVGICLVIILVISGMPFSALASEEGSSDAEILIVYNNNPTKEEIADIQTIIKTLTYLQHSVMFFTVEESTPILQNYKNIICYGLRGELESFLDALIKADKNVFWLGSEGVEDYVKEMNYPFTSHKNPSTVATVEYIFSEGNKFNSLLDLQDIVVFDGYFTYQNGTITVEGEQAGMYSRYQDFIYLPFSDMSNPLIQESFTKEIAQWLWPYNGEPHPYAQYIVLDEVYPFTSPTKLLEVVDYMISYKLPFVISVMPIYENGEYPSMQRFCEVLRYAQANDGAIIMHTPIMQQDRENIEQIHDYVTTATEAYTNLGVYPIGIEVPENYMFDKIGREILQRYSTVFFYDDGEQPKIDLDEHFNEIFRDGHKIIGLAVAQDEMGNSMTKVRSTAFYIDAFEDVDTIKEKISSCIKSNVPLKSLWETDNSVYADNFYLYTKQGEVFINNEKVVLEYIPAEYKEDFNYQSTVFQWIAADLKGLNKKLIVFVAVASIIFVVFIIMARRVNKKKFLYSKEGGKEK